jgi:hypothetical protein
MRNAVAHLSLCDLQTVRVGHKECGAVIELPLDALVKRDIGPVPLATPTSSRRRAVIAPSGRSPGP